MAARMMQFLGWLLSLLFPYEGGSVWDSNHPPESRS
jgi:hypothetical protein